MDLILAAVTWLAHWVLLVLPGILGVEVLMYKARRASHSETQIREWKRQTTRARWLVALAGAPFAIALGRAFGYSSFTDLPTFIMFGALYGSLDVFIQTISVIAFQVTLSYIGAFFVAWTTIKADLLEQSEERIPSRRGNKSVQPTRRALRALGRLTSTVRCREAICVPVTRGALAKANRLRGSILEIPCSRGCASLAPKQLNSSNGTSPL